jgi:hypothetical protein
LREIAGCLHNQIDRSITGGRIIQSDVSAIRHEVA